MGSLFAKVGGAKTPPINGKLNKSKRDGAGKAKEHSKGSSNWIVMCTFGISGIKVPREDGMETSVGSTFKATN